LIGATSGVEVRLGHGSGSGCAGTQGLHIADEDTATIEVDEVFFAQFVEDQRYGLAAGAGDVSDILVGQAVLEQHLVAYPAAPLRDDLVKEEYDTTAGVLEDEVFQLVLGGHHALAEQQQHLLAENGVLRQDALEIGNTDGVVINFFLQRLGSLGPRGLADEGEFSENSFGVDQLLDDFLTVGAVGADFDRTFAKQVDVLAGFSGLVDDGITRLRRAIFGALFITDSLL